MPLPENGAPWPPPAWAPVYAEMRVDDAWYSGDRDRIASVYRAAPLRVDRTRRLWGRTAPAPGQPEQRLHVPLAGDIASASADLLFSETPTFTVGDTAAQQRLDVLLDEGAVGETLLAAAEVASPMSGVFLRVTWDRDLADRALLTSVHPDCAIPEFRFSMLRAVTFWRELASDTTQTVWRHLERHEPGSIRHALYQGTPDNLGHAVPLTDHPETAELAESLDRDGDGQTITTGTQQLTAVYVPNILPNRRHRGSPLGRSDYQGVHDLFDALDETWSSWMRDIRLARARLIVPNGYLRNEGPGRGASFDGDREIFEALNIPPTEGTGITLSQFAIRVEEHARTGEAIVRQAVQSAGYSPQSFGLDGPAAATATEIDARERRSDVTSGKKARYWRRALAEIVHVLLQVDAHHFGSRITPERPVVEFAKAAPNPQDTATTLDLLTRAQATSTETRVRILHPEWDDTAVREEVERILAETGTAAPDPVGTFPL